MSLCAPRGVLSCSADKPAKKSSQARVGLQYRNHGSQVHPDDDAGHYCSQDALHFVFQLSPRKMHGISTEQSTISKFERLTATFGIEIIDTVSWAPSLAWDPFVLCYPRLAEKMPTLKACDGDQSLHARCQIKTTARVISELDLIVAPGVNPSNSSSSYGC